MTLAGGKGIAEEALRKPERLFIPFPLVKQVQRGKCKLESRKPTAAAYPLMILGSIIWCCGQMDAGFW
jgi:hypothetical protein